VIEASHASTFVEALRAPGPLLSAELRPPPADLPRSRLLEAWIDAHHGVSRLLRDGRFVLFTDDAVGDREEESLGHLTANLGEDADLSRVIPFLTCKHALDYCLLFARRGASRGMGAITVTGGDTRVGPPRCLPRARDLRARIRSHTPGIPLGAWANPFRDPAEQVGFLLEDQEHADYYLTQVVSHLDLEPLDRFLDEVHRRGLALPGVFGVFHYRSANPRTLARLSDFLPVPHEGLRQAFAEDGIRALDVTARTIEALRARGIEKVYVSNLTMTEAPSALRALEHSLGDGVSK
jgi:hypothetical protein